MSVGTLLEIEPATGRMHQIRVQFAHRGWPVVGDAAYGARTQFAGSFTGPEGDSNRCEAIALHARRLTLWHPVRYDLLSIEAPPPASWGAFIPGESQFAPTG
jgi:23S rRNA pseudouridine1911/1915/1917 synthase